MPTVRRPRVGSIVETAWGTKSKLIRIGDGGLAIKETLVCSSCLKAELEVCLRPGADSSYSYVVDERTGAILADLRNQVYVCSKKKCKIDYWKSPHELPKKGKK